MAPAASKSRDNQFFNVGVQGRKTGITLKDTGVRDEHGMEPIDGIFSSPEKSPEQSPPKRSNARQQADRTLTSSDMDVQQSMPRKTFGNKNQRYDSLIDELLASDEEGAKTTLLNIGSMPEPADALSARKSIRPGRSSIFPPPMGRSPIKTSLGSSPRRQSSMGPPSGLRRTSDGPNRAGSQPTVARRLDFGAVDETNARAPGSGSRNRGPPRPDIFDLPTSPARNKKRTHEESFVEDETVLEESELAINGVGEDSPLPDVEDTLPILDQGGDTEPDEPDEPIEESMDIPEEPQPRPSLTKGRGKARKSLDRRESPPPAPSPAPKKKAGRPKKTQGLVSARASNATVPARSRTAVQSRPVSNRQVEDESAMDIDQSIEEASMPQVGEEETEELEDKIEEGEETEPDTEPEQEPEPEPEVEPESEPEPASPPAKKKRGRPKTGSKPDVHVDEPEEPVQLPERPAKKAKKAPASKKPPPSQRGPNARVTSKKDSAKNKSKGKQKEDMPPPPLPPVSQTSSQPESSQSRAASQARSLQILRQGTPFEDVGAKTTRSGRISTKPVEYWRNERIEYGHDGTKKEIIRAEDVEETKRPAARARPRKRTTKRSESAIEEEPEMELEEWEINEGQFQGWVNGWDEKQNIIIDEGGRHEELAYSAVKLQTREVAGANFRYSKILGTPFFGAGMVDIPPHGSKRSKNSRRMYMAFCLLSGKVSVTVGDNEFSISKGGVFMVPRGNFYSITNDNEVPARIFFAQGCEVAPEPEQATPSS
ncbi:Centromere protein 3 [Lasiodiplodia theobromae]|uniref:CENP-C homolog n=1 Tax=Lasiodiplodia theobromae TaxID=45133 RepID=A0A5N5D5W0_9PEZI|nr:Centromere protein 3 [Lasiodiplodia theobromae]